MPNRITDRISELIIPAAGQQFHGDDFRSLQKPGVYILLRQSVPIYVGCSNSILRRLASPHHNRLAISEYDHVLMYPCRSIQDAKELEALLISELHPYYNQTGHYRKARQILGIKAVGNIIDKLRTVTKAKM